MRVLHFGDIHFWEIGTDVDFYYLKRILGPINLFFRRRKRFPREFAERVAADILEREADLVVFSGDASTNSLPAEFARAKRALDPIYEKWGDRFFCIPGNHDRYTPRSVRERYWERTFPFSRYDEKRVHSIQFCEGLTVVGFDASVPWRFRSNGLFTESLKQEVESELQRVASSGDRVLLVGHYPFSFPEGIVDSAHHNLLGEDLLADTVGRFKPVAYCHGHKHIRWGMRPDSAPETVCFNCGAAGMKSSARDRQAGYLEFELKGDSFSVASAEARVLTDEGVKSFPLEIQ